MITDTRREQLRAALGNPANIDNATGDFSDLVATTPKRYVHLTDPKRIVPGADDAGVVRRSGGGGVTIPKITPTNVGISRDDLRTEGQRNYMELLIKWIGEYSPADQAKARVYTDSMTERGRWEAGRGGNVSIWIDRLKAKHAELKAESGSLARCANCNTTLKPDWCSVCRQDTPESRPANVQHDELPVRETKTGKPMPQYYAVELDGVTKFYRVKAGTKPGWWWIEAQASDEFHPVKNVTTKNTILRAIIAQGAEECLRNYGRLINSCGRCHRTLTDATSRANGIGPECEGKL